MESKRYTAEYREWALQQMMPPVNRAVVELAKATGVTTVTLRTWQKLARAEGRIVAGDVKKSDGWSSTNKFRMVLETAPLSAEELSAYCRTKGIYPEQLAQWRLACEQANRTDQSSAAGGVRKPALAGADAVRIRELERKLKKTDASLAEAEALLVLRKKVAAIWGKDVEE